MFDSYKTLQSDLNRLPVLRRVVVINACEKTPGPKSQTLRLPGLIEALKWEGQLPTAIAESLVPCQHLVALSLADVSNAVVVASVLCAIGGQRRQLHLLPAPVKSDEEGLHDCLTRYLQSGPPRLQHLVVAIQLYSHQIIHALPPTLREFGVRGRYNRPAQFCVNVHFAMALGSADFLPFVTAVPSPMVDLERLCGRHGLSPSLCGQGSNCTFVSHQLYGLLPLNWVAERALIVAEQGINARRLRQASEQNGEEVVGNSANSETFCVIYRGD